jgi:hypothetical protein
MNKNLLIALPLAAVLALPALAQNTSSTQTQSSSQTTQTTSTDSATGKAPLTPGHRSARTGWHQDGFG